MEGFEPSDQPAAILARALTQLPRFCENRHYDMRMPNGHSCHPSLGSALLAILLLCAGCQTTTQNLFTASGPGWRVQEGQAIWRPSRDLPEISGDLVLAMHEDSRCLVQFDKAPLSLVSVQTTRTQWLIQFPPRRMGFSGHGPGPTRFAWLYLHTALAGEPLPSSLRFERKPDGNWRLENLRTGETLEGVFFP